MAHLPSPFNRFYYFSSIFLFLHYLSFSMYNNKKWPKEPRVWFEDGTCDLSICRIFVFFFVFAELKMGKKIVTFHLVWQLDSNPILTWQMTCASQNWKIIHTRSVQQVINSLDNKVLYVTPQEISKTEKFLAQKDQIHTVTAEIWLQRLFN